MDSLQQIEFAQTNHFLFILALNQSTTHEDLHVNQFAHLLIDENLLTNCM